MWIYDGGQWVLRPWPFASSPGCVITRGKPRSFGLARALYWTVGVLSGLILVGLYLLGHEVEVLGAVFAAWLVGAVVDLARSILGRGSGEAADGKTVGGGR
ncbi:hypothetical protein [Streptomyces sp. NPDC007205]|uniref:hypothetical protein n=1 Tax=Streptomyces sp. NPDC007205 TaxID=3154316 RepID=UPI0033F26E60